MTAVSLRTFLGQLFDHGRVEVSPPHLPFDPEDLLLAEKCLLQQDQLLRSNAPDGVPPLALATAMWGAKTLYRLCQLIAYRALDEAAISELLSAPCPSTEIDRHWSVDLTFWFLPDVLRHATAASSEDPLVRHIRALAAQWPLSTVGMQVTNLQHEAEIVASPGLLLLYVDRILAKTDLTRLTHPDVQAAAKQAIGLHTNLWPDIVKHLEPFPPVTAP